MFNKPNKKKNNKGSGLVTVIIAMAFVAVLGSIVMTATLTNYRMKQNNLQTKDNFYSAEQALDEIRVGLQGLVSDAISEAYLEVLQNYSAYDLEKKNQLMESKYFQTIWNALRLGTDNKKYDVRILENFLVETKWVDLPDGGGHGAIVATVAGKNSEMIAYQDTGVILKNLEVYFRDEKGYVSIIQTDIKLAIPNLQFASNTALPDITLYTTVADSGIEFGQRGTHTVEGSLYASYIKAKGATDKSSFKINFNKAGQIVSKKEVDFQNVTITTNDDSEFWTNGVVLEHADLTLAGKSNIADDLNIKGDGNKVVISGEYNGYGNSMTEPSKSSAILVNGNNTILDLKNTKKLALAGHSYIGTGKVNQGAGGVQGEPEKTKNIIMGESIAVKGNQLLYLIPGECIGVKKSVENGNTIYGASKYGKNPLTKTQYEEIAGRSDYAEIDEKSMVAKLGNPLSKYLDYNGTTPKPEKIFVQTNGETLVYYYMTFADEEKANEYFNDYYGLNQQKTDEYIDFYTNGITMPDPKVMLQLQLAGNVVKFDQTTKTGNLQKNTVKDASVKMASAAQTYASMFDALCTRLVTNYSELTDLKESDLSKDIVFENIVNIPDFQKFINDNASFSMPKQITFEKAGAEAVLVHNGAGSSDTTPYRYHNNPNVHLIIASGDVIVQSDFSGLILANGKVTVEDGVSIKANSDEVKKVLRAYKEVDGTVYNLIGFLWDGKEMLNAAGHSTEGGDENVKLSDLVIYENWSKN